MTVSGSGVVPTVAPATFALITPSYEADFERCRTLVASVERFVPASVDHYLLVDRRDEALFSQLASRRTHVVTKEALLPRWLWAVPGTGWWLNLKGLPARGWIIQQIIKLSAHRVTQAEGLLFADSDMFFVRPFDPQEAVRDGRVPLFREQGPPLATPELQRWSRVASRLLDLPIRDHYDVHYVGQLVWWRRSHLEALHAHVQAVTGRSLEANLLRQSTFAEYVLYGLFVEHVLGAASGHYPTDQIHTLNYWDTAALKEPELQAFRERVRPEHVAVMISAKSHTPPALVDRVFELRT